MMTDNTVTNAKGYIYVRTHSAYDVHGAVKLGKTVNIHDRDAQYATGEITRGIFSLVLEVCGEDLDDIEILVQREFYAMRVFKDAGTEFFGNGVVDCIIPYLERERIWFRRLSVDEIHSLPRTKKLLLPTNTDKVDVSVHEILGRLKSRLSLPPPPPIQPMYVPRPDQLEIIQETLQHFKTNHAGVLVLMCGVGKTLISLWVSQRLSANTVFIGVPNILLLTQWKNTVRLLFGDDVPILLVDGDCSTEKVIAFLTKSFPRCVVISTYGSSYKVVRASVKMSFVFDMKILDEVHHITRDDVVGVDSDRKYITVLKIPFKNQLSLTATLKHLEDHHEDTLGIISNDDVEIFGEIIDRRELAWAIRENILCDYVVQTIVSDTDTVDYHASRFNITTPNDKRLFLSAFSALKSISIGDSHHLLIYANDTPNTRKIVEYVNRMLASKCFFTNSTRFGTTSTSTNIYCSVYTSELSTIVQQTTLKRFEQSPFGILVCVYCLGEGWDLPLLDGVVFAENMTSTIRIVQSALRPCRKNMNEPHKRSKIILPIYDPTNELLMTTSTTPCQSEDMMKIKTVIGQLSQEDTDILHRIQTFRMSIESDTSNPVGISSKSVENSIGILDASLTERLNLKTTTRYDFVMQYHKAKQLLTRKGLKSPKEYAELCEKDKRFPLDPMKQFGISKFKGWMDYLGIDKTKYYTLDQCKSHVRTYISTKSIQISPLNVTNVCNDAHHSNELMIPSPDLWNEVYNINALEDIAVTPRIAKKCTRKL